MSLVQVIASV